MSEKKQKTWIWILIPVIGGIWHFLDVRAGAVATGRIWLQKGYLALFLFLILGLAGICFFPKLGKNRKKKKWNAIERIYFIGAFVCGTAFLFVLPPLSAPDEISHYVSAYQVASYILGKQSTAEDGHVLIRGEDAWIEDLDGIRTYHKNEEGFWKPDDFGLPTTVLAQVLEQDSYGVLYGGESRTVREEQPQTFAKEEMVVSPFPPVVTTLAAYLPQAIGIALGRLMGLPTEVLLYLGRIGNLIFLIAVTTLSIHRAPFGKELFAGVGLLPMTLHLAASFSYDCMILAGMFYLTALCMDLAFGERDVRIADVIVMMIIMATAGPCKMIYVVLAGLCLLVPIRRFGGVGKWLISAGLVLGIWVVAMYFINRQTVITYATETESYVGWAEETGYSLSYLIHNPLQTIRIFYQTILWQGETFHQTMIGSLLGNLDAILDVPYPIVLWETALLILLALKKPGEQNLLSMGNKIWIWILCAACGGAVMLSMLIAWTPISSPVILGVQGRYFLPFLPVLLMTFKNDSLVLTKDRNSSILFLVCCLDSYVLLRLYSIVCLRV